MNERMTDEQVEQEIENLRKSPYVKLAKKAEYIRNQRRQRMYMLRYYDKKGRAMAEVGITMEMLDMLAYIQEQKEKTGALSPPNLRTTNICTARGVWTKMKNHQICTKGSYYVCKTTEKSNGSAWHERQEAFRCNGNRQFQYQSISRRKEHPERWRDAGDRRCTRFSS